MATVKDIRHFENAEDYTKRFIIQEEIDKYLPGGRHFIDEDLINRTLAAADAAPVDPTRIREIIAKSEQTCETLTVEEVAALMRVEDLELFEEMRAGSTGVASAAASVRLIRSSSMKCLPPGRYLSISSWTMKCFV